LAQQTYQKNPTTPRANMTDTPWGQSDDYRRLAEATSTARLEYFRTLGQPDQDAWLPAAVPEVPGGPVWPTRPAWRRIRDGKQTIVSSSGLTDPFGIHDGPNLGFGVEVALATTDEIPEKLHPSWLLDLTVAVSNQAAIDGRFYLRAAKFGVFLFGVPGPKSYANWLDSSGTLGFLIGVPAPGVEPIMKLPVGSAAFLITKLLTPKEYEFVASRGLDGALKLVSLFDENGTHHLSSLNRPSVV
jgi:hypothetical protein